MVSKRSIAGAALAVALLPFISFAQTSDLQTQVQALLSQIKGLQEQLKTLVAANPSLNLRMGTTTPKGGESERGDGNGKMMPPGQVGKMVCIALNRNLGSGSRGDDVKNIQQALKDEGHFDGQPTGFFGPATMKAMMKFQANNNISATGNVGPLTRGLFERRCGEGLGGGKGDEMRGKVTGTITASSASSITLQNKDGASIVVNFTASTSIQVWSGTSTPPSAGTAADLLVGKMAAVEGQKNTDGSIRAVHITVGTRLPPPPPMGGDDRGPKGMMPIMNGQGGDNRGSGPQNW